MLLKVSDLRIPRAGNATCTSGGSLAEEKTSKEETSKTSGKCSSNVHEHDFISLVIQDLVSVDTCNSIFSLA